MIAMVLLVSSPLLSLGQARLSISNNSQREMTVKVMKESGTAAKVHEITTIVPHGTKTVYFSETGDYFTKTKAVVKGKHPVYQKGKPFHVVNNKDGYSVLTLTFSIKESNVPEVTGGKQISKEEFDRD
jgi:hypothetical protein